jgi:hypothetical protein
MKELILQDNFIGAWFLEDISICDRLIQYYESLPERQVKGKLGLACVNEEQKKCKEIFFTHEEELIYEYIFSLQKVCEEYIKKYRFSAAGAGWSIIEKVKIQKYDPGDGYYTWHWERSAPKFPEVYRHLVFMTYLNDVNDEGETEFFYQKLKVRPQKGLTLIWPADWTHTHRGVASMSQTKYIITGWYNYEKLEI